MNRPSDYIPGVPYNPAVAGGVSQTSFDNFTFIGSPDYLLKQQVPQQWQYVDTVSGNHGAHAFKLGADVRAPMPNIYQDEASTRGTWNSAGRSPVFRVPEVNASPALASAMRTACSVW